jgi:hypothetical protein
VQAFALFCAGLLAGGTSFVKAVLLFLASSRLVGAEIYEFSKSEDGRRGRGVVVVMGRGVVVVRGTHGRSRQWYVDHFPARLLLSTCAHVGPVCE